MHAARPVGTVQNLWRYPVKSMLGERRDELPMTALGALGDRAWALRDLGSGRIASAKKYPRLLTFRSSYVIEPTHDSSGRVAIELPGGRTVHADDAEASDLISNILGVPVHLENHAGSNEKTGIDPSSVFGDVPASKFKPDWTPETMPNYFELKKDSFFEIGSVYLLTSGSVEHLRTCHGKTAAIDQRRFRPNIYIESGREWSGFVEDAWIGGALAIGETFVVNEFQSTVWCVMSTLTQEELPRDLSILRTIASHHKGCLGVYGTVRSSGTVRVGDPVILLN